MIQHHIALLDSAFPLYGHFAEDLAEVPAQFSVKVFLRHLGISTIRYLQSCSLGFCTHPLRNSLSCAWWLTRRVFNDGRLP